MKALTLFAPVLALLMGHGLSLVADSAPQAKVVGTQDAGQFFKVGDAREFYQVDFVQAGNNPADGFFKTNFQCVRAGKLSYIFVEKELIDTQSPFKPADSYLDMVFNHFERMAPTLHTVYGKPTDVDGNGRFIILVSHIRDWFYHHVETPDMVPVQGYLWPDFVPMNGNDYLTLAHDAPKTDLTGTLVHEFVHNIFDSKNPNAADPRDRGITEALANYAIRINGTLGEDQYFAYQKGVLTQDLQNGKLVNPFDGTVDYLDPLAPDFHQAYAAGYYFMEHIVDECLGGSERRRNAFFQDLIALASGASSMEKLRCAMIRHGLLPQDAGGEHVERYYREVFAPWLSQKLENNLLTNGGFEKGVRGWKGHLASIGKWEKQPAFEGRQNAWMGGNGKARRESLSQTLSLPMAAEKLTLKFQIHIDTAEKSAVAAHDKFTVSVLGEQGQLLGILDRLSNLDAAAGYKEKSYDLSAFKGQKIQIEFKASEDSANQTSFVLDDVCVMGQ